MRYSAVKNNTESARKKRRSPAIPTLIVFLMLSALFPVRSVNAQPSADLSAYRLIGTVVAGGFTGAVLDDAKGEQTFYRLNEILPDASKIIKVRSDGIQLKRSDGTVQEIFISHETKTAMQQTAPRMTSPPPPNITPSGDGLPPKAFPRKQRRIRRSSKAEE
jgi:hypothetical protein